MLQQNNVKKVAIFYSDKLKISVVQFTSTMLNQ